jgi:rhamnosyltransferase subunit B
MHTQFIFTGTGTLGDLLPMLAIARELLARGHDCHVLGNDSAGPLAQEQGIPFTAIAPAQTNNLTSVEENFGKYVFPSYAPTLDFVERALRRSSRLVVINPEHYAASTLVCERRGLPLCRLVLTPFRMRSLIAPHWPWSAKLAGPFGQAFRRYTLPALYERRYRHPFILNHMNRERRRINLAPIDTLRDLEPLVDHHICLFPDWYCPPARDWPKRLDVVGFPLPETRGHLPQRLLEFIAREGPPIVFTPGTGVTDVAAFFREARRACELLGAPGIFLSPHLRSETEDWGRVLCFDYLELGLVLSRAALLVHHGGIGTTARALEAKVPQIICPRAYDQPDNAHRITSLGVGASIEPDQWTAAALVRAVTDLLGDAKLRARIETLGESVRNGKAITRAADIIIERFSPRIGREAINAASSAVPLEIADTVLSSRIAPRHPSRHIQETHHDHPHPELFADLPSGVGRSHVRQSAH